jgi:predicted secreted protein
MHWVVLVGAYVILWFLVLQILLPIGVQHGEPDAEAAAGMDPGAPANAHISVKLIGATVIAGIVWTIFYGLVLAGVVNV